jgi:hypothetical protein
MKQNEVFPIRSTPAIAPLLFALLACVPLPPLRRRATSVTLPQRRRPRTPTQCLHPDRILELLSAARESQSEVDVVRFTHC